MKYYHETRLQWLSRDDISHCIYETLSHTRLLVEIVWHVEDITGRGLSRDAVVYGRIELVVKTIQARYDMIMPLLVHIIIIVSSPLSTRWTYQFVGVVTPPSHHRHVHRSYNILSWLCAITMFVVVVAYWYCWSLYWRSYTTEGRPHSAVVIALRNTSPGTTW